VKHPKEMPPKSNLGRSLIKSRFSRGRTNADGTRVRTHANSLTSRDTTQRKQILLRGLQKINNV
jgi:hypothetical protein